VIRRGRKWKERRKEEQEGKRNRTMRRKGYAAIRIVRHGKEESLGDRSMTEGGGETRGTQTGRRTYLGAPVPLSITSSCNMNLFLGKPWN